MKAQPSKLNDSNDSSSPAEKGMLGRQKQYKSITHVQSCVWLKFRVCFWKDGENILKEPKLLCKIHSILCHANLFILLYFFHLFLFWFCSVSHLFSWRGLLSQNLHLPHYRITPAAWNHIVVFPSETNLLNAIFPSSISYCLPLVKLVNTLCSLYLFFMSADFEYLPPSDPLSKRSYNEIHLW